MQLMIGFLLAASITVLAWRLGALSASGALAATLAGGLIYGLGGLNWAILLLAFFLSSSAWSRVFSSRKAGLAGMFSKGSRRDAGQVLANGGLGVAMVLLHAIFPGSPWPWVAFAGSMAAVNADTWATELGVFSSVPPRLITGGRIVERGASGGVTLLGYLAALCGSGLIGVLAGVLNGQVGAVPAALIAAVTLAGVAGSTVDSLLGATLQAIYVCPQCARETERHPLHTCGAPTALRRGLPWLDNDWVNFFSSGVGALLAWVLYFYLFTS